MDSIDVMRSKVEFPTENKSKDKRNMQVRDGIMKLFAGFRKQCNDFFEDSTIYENLESVANHLKANPLLACGLCTVLIGISIPIVIFILFVVVNIAFVIGGFIILEVSVCIVGATVIASSVFFVITTAGIISLSVLLFYLIFCYFIALVRKWRM